ncbi:MAG: hypothetical protein PHS02_03990 [Candidatus ainarchaeum sp.]|nr:hypothetical protein [Candidatus ainarchaeum sp.]
MKTRKGEELKFGASNFVRSDYVEMRLQKLEERLERLERIVESFTRPPFSPRTIR